MSYYLKRLERQMQLKKEREAPPPAESSSLGAAIEQLIDSAVEERVADALEKQRPAHNPRVPPHLREFTDKPFSDTFPAPPPKARPPMPVITMSRDAAGRIRSASVGNLTFNVERDGAGKVQRLGPQEET